MILVHEEIVCYSQSMLRRLIAQSKIISLTVQNDERGNTCEHEYAHIVRYVRYKCDSYNARLA